MTALKLARIPGHASSGPVLLVVMDGVGIGRLDEGDAVHLARTPTLDRLARGPMVRLAAHGTAVGMPSDADMGNSEVGHNALGAGRVFAQGAKLVDAAVDTGSLWGGRAWQEVVGPASCGEGALHFIGLLSDGNVHSHIDQLEALLDRAVTEGCSRVYVHTLLDGRDVPETSALLYIDRLEAKLAELREVGDDLRIASGGGRMLVTMDRYEADWSIVERGWKAHVLGQGRSFASAREAIETYREETPGLADQFMSEFVVVQGGRPVGTIEDGDGVIFFNFRGDRAIEISRAFTEDDFDGFDRIRRPDVRLAGLMQYDGDTNLPPRFLVEPPAIERTISEYLAAAGVTQLATAETQKYGHVTYFWNGNRSGAFEPELEEYIEVRSDAVPFEQRPWMKVAEVTDAMLDALLREVPPDFLRLNFANGDMVGHTGHLDATVVAVEAVDLQLARLLKAIERVGGVALVTADHGNADQMFQLDKKTGGYKDEPLTSHTLNPVPLYLFDPVGGRGLRQLDGAGLANVAATILELLGFAAPQDYEASLIF